MNVFAALIERPVINIAPAARPPKTAERPPRKAKPTDFAVRSERAKRGAITRSLVTRFPFMANSFDLTGAECAVVQAAADGMSVRETAEHLSLTVKTVEVYRSHALIKMKRTAGAKNLHHAVVLWDRFITGRG